MPVNHDGEGGVFILAEQCGQLMKNKALAITFSILGISFFFGDAMHTPAISILSAVEGLKTLSPYFEPYVVPFSVLIVGALFAVQNRGSGVLGKYFGYIMFIWFISIGLFGLWHVVSNITILKALNPWYGIHYLSTNGFKGLLSMGGVILAITGCEALYADMGHFGSKPIKNGWYFIVLPSLALSYLGQGALLLKHPEFFNSPFYSMLPTALIIPMVILSCFATIIASQAVLSGIFSLGWQAILIRYFPRMTVRQTSNVIAGQVYIPKLNSIFCVLTILMILCFKSSDNIASAYGLCVASTMILTVILISVHGYLSKRWSLLKNIILLTPLFILDVIFCFCCLTKMFDGAWTAVSASATVFIIIQIWVRGNKKIDNLKQKGHFEIVPFIKRHVQEGDPKIPGVSVFFSRVPNTIPTSFAAHVRQNKYIHEKAIFLSVIRENHAKVAGRNHFRCEEV